MKYRQWKKNIKTYCYDNNTWIKYQDRKGRVCIYTKGFNLIDVYIKDINPFSENGCAKITHKFRKGVKVKR